MPSPSTQDHREAIPRTLDPKAGPPGRGAPTPPGEPVCPACGERCREQSQFCPQCGAALLRYCPRCGREIPLDAELCDHCASLETKRAVPVGRCQGCGFQNRPEAETCQRCGARLLARCPRCGTLSAGTFDYCPRCGFHYSRFVTDRVLHRLDEDHEAPAPTGRRLDPSSVLIIVLVTLSLLLMLYILWQIR